MKARWGFCSLLVFILTLNAFSQTLKDTKLSELKAPSAPAFTVLGVQPTDISRPKDLNSLEVGLLNSISNNSTYVIPTNVALEVTPFWLVPRRITFAQLESKTDFFTRLYSNLSISLATSTRKNLVDTTLNVTQIGIGGRTLLAQGRHVPISTINTTTSELIALFEATNLVSDLIDIATDYLDDNPGKLDSANPSTNNILLLELLAYPYTKVSQDTDNSPIRTTRLTNIVTDINKNEKAKTFVIQLYNEVVKPYIQSKRIATLASAKTELRNLNLEIDTYKNNNKEFIQKLESVKKYRNKRVGFICELAFALALEAPNNKYRSLNQNRSGVWVTMTHRPENTQSLEGSFLMRYLYTNTELKPKNPNNFDTGVRISFDNNRLIFSGEFLYRYAFSTTKASNIRDLSGPEATRWGAVLGYHINENIVINATLGKTFDNDTINPGGIISILGVNFGIGKPTLVPN